MYVRSLVKLYGQPESALERRYQICVLVETCYMIPKDVVHVDCTTFDASIYGVNKLISLLSNEETCLLMTFCTLRIQESVTKIIQNLVNHLH